MRNRHVKAALVLLLALSGMSLTGGAGRLFLTAGAFLGGNAQAASASGMSITAAAPPTSQPAGAGFTYQGKLLDNGQPVDGQYDLNFRLFDQPEVGTQIGPTAEVQGQTVTGGLFTALLDFGSEPFQGDARWLQIEVRPAGAGEYVILGPRQPITPTPYAIYAQSAQNARTAPWSGVTEKPWPYNPLRLANTFSVADRQDDVGQYASTTIGADGLPLAAYYDVANGDLKVVHCNDLVCSDRSVSTVDSTDNVGRYASVTIGVDALPLISYYDATNQALKVAHCEDPACQAATISVIDSGGYAGRFGAITTGSDGRGLIVYGKSSPKLYVAHCEDQSCTSARIVALSAATSFVTEQVSVAVGGDGLPLIAFAGTWKGLQLSVAHCDNPDCSHTTVSFLGACCTSYPHIADSMPVSLAIGPDGLGLIAYSGVTPYRGDYQSTLNLAHCSNSDCSSADVSTVKVDREGPTVYATGLFASLSLRPNGLPSITFYDNPASNHQLQLASCLDPLCDNAGISTLDSGGDVGRFSSLAMGLDGLPVAAYYDVSNGDLKLLHCGSPQCVSYQRQR